jgi:hypothetical protein
MRDNFSNAIGTFERILSHIKGFEFDLDKEHYDCQCLERDIDNVRNAVGFALRNHPIFCILFEHILYGIEIENVYGRPKMDFDVSAKHTFKLFGKEIEVQGWEYLDVLSWVLNKRRAIENNEKEF